MPSLSGRGSNIASARNPLEMRNRTMDFVGTNPKRAQAWNVVRWIGKLRLARSVEDLPRKTLCTPLVRGLCPSHGRSGSNPRAFRIGTENAHLVICFWIVVNWNGLAMSCVCIEFRNSLVPARNADPEKSMRGDARQ
jgi:hypothetical protein